MADGCICVSNDKRRNRFVLNITSANLRHLFKIRRALRSKHKIGKKPSSNGNIGFQFQIRNSIITNDLVNLGIKPRKTLNLKPIKVPDKYFSDFARGFFDGDGTVYIYKVNDVPQIKAGFVCSSLEFLKDFNKKLCKRLNIIPKNIHTENTNKSKMPRYSINFYIDDCEKLMHFMYRKDNCLRLERKFKIFKRWGEIKRRVYIKRAYPSKIGWQLNRKILAKIT